MYIGYFRETPYLELTQVIFAFEKRK